MTDSVRSGHFGETAPSHLIGCPETFTYSVEYMNGKTTTTLRRREEEEMPTEYNGSTVKLFTLI